MTGPGRGRVRVRTLWSCPCGFDAESVWPRYSPDWYRAHRDHHLAHFPNVDAHTRATFEMLITAAERVVS